MTGAYEPPLALVIFYEAAEVGAYLGKSDISLFIAINDNDRHVIKNNFPGFS